MEHSAAHLDLEAVERYLAAHLPGFQGPLTAEKFAVGQSNPTFRLDSPSGPLVLRRKPPGVLLKSAHAVDREFRVQRALAGSRQLHHVHTAIAGGKRRLGPASHRHFL